MDTVLIERFDPLYSNSGNKARFQTVTPQLGFNHLLGVFLPSCLFTLCQECGGVEELGFDLFQFTYLGFKAR